MKRTDEMDILFLREILAEEPYQYTPKSKKEKRSDLERIAYNLNTLKEPKFTVNHRSVRDRYNILTGGQEKAFIAELTDLNNSDFVTK